MIRSNVLAAALILASGSAWGWGDDCDFTAERTLDVDADGLAALELLAGAGDLRIEGRAGQARIELRGKACASSEDLLAQIQLVQRRDGARTTIEAQMPDSRSWSDDEQATLDLVVTVPASLALGVRDSSGDVEVRSVASLDLTDSSGDATIAGIAGDVALEDSSGDLDVRDVAGDVRVRVDSSGDIGIQGVRGAVLVERDSSGGILLQDIEGDASVEIDSSGDVDFRNIGGSALVGTDSSGSIEAQGVAKDFTVRRDGSGSIDHRDVLGKVSVPAR